VPCAWSRPSAVRSATKCHLEGGATARVGEESLRVWVKRAQIDAGTRPGLTTEEREELKRLRKENFELQRANDILQAAATFFGRSSTADRRGSYLHRRPPDSLTRGRRWESSRSAPNCRSPQHVLRHQVRPVSARQRRDEELGPALEAIWKKNYSVYGRRKLTKAAKRRDSTVVATKSSDS